MVEYILCYGSPAEHWGPLPAARLAGRKILIEQNIKKRTGPALCVLCVHTSPHPHPLSCPTRYCMSVNCWWYSFRGYHIPLHLRSPQVVVQTSTLCHQDGSFNFYLCCQCIALSLYIKLLMVVLEMFTAWFLLWIVEERAWQLYTTSKIFTADCRHFRQSLYAFTHTSSNSVAYDFFYVYFWKCIQVFNPLHELPFNAKLFFKFSNKNPLLYTSESPRLFHKPRLQNHR